MQSRASPAFDAIHVVFYPTEAWMPALSAGMTVRNAKDIHSD
jgi:hypothetical protein